MPRHPDPRFQTVHGGPTSEARALDKERRLRRERERRVEREIFNSATRDLRQPDQPDQSETGDQSDTPRWELLCDGLVEPVHFTDDQMKEW